MLYHLTSSLTMSAVGWLYADDASQTALSFSNACTTVGAVMKPPSCAEAWLDVGVRLYGVWDSTEHDCSCFDRNVKTPALYVC
jgi:hypothetical protein